MSATEYTIGELADEFDVTTRTIRFYEDKGLLSPARNGTRRIFSVRDRTRLRLVLRGRRIGLSLAEIAEIVDMYDEAPGERGQLGRLLERIEERKEALVDKQVAIERTLGDLDAVAERARTRLDQIHERDC
ncbi:MAG: MerR family transcriptional regulator [Acidimicrobiia bacterium]